MRWLFIFILMFSGCSFEVRQGYELRYSLFRNNINKNIMEQYEKKRTGVMNTTIFYALMNDTAIELLENAYGKKFSRTAEELRENYYLKRYYIDRENHSDVFVFEFSPRIWAKHYRADLVFRLR